MIEPVVLSGGDSGGEIVEGDGWPMGEVRDVGGLLYRRDDDFAIFVGMA